MKKQVLIIIGAMKCGTTTLFHYLSQHPEIIPAKDKEPHFFSQDPVYKKGFRWYENLWDSDVVNGVYLEASTTYTMYPKYPRVIERLKEAQQFYDFYFIYILRNPLLRIESHMRHLIAGGHVDHQLLIDDYFWFSEYARQLELYERAFGRDHIHLMLLEDLKMNPGTEINRIYDFLHLPSELDISNDFDLVLNSQQTLNLNPFVRKIYNSRWVKPTVQRFIPPAVRQVMYQPLSRKQPLDVKLSQSEQEACMARLSADLGKLQSHYGVDINKWNLPYMKPT